MGIGRAPTKDAEKAYKAFAPWRRLRGCIDSTGSPYWGICITCKRRFAIQKLEVGHAKGGRHNLILCNRFLTDVQCGYCNRTKHGYYKKFRAALVERHGEAFVARQYFRFDNRIIKTASVDWLKRVKRFRRWMKRDIDSAI